MPRSSLVLILPDLHYPNVDWPTWNAMMAMAEERQWDGVVFLGDQFDNHSISHHTEGMPGQRFKGAFVEEEQGFDRKILKPIEKVVGRRAWKTWISGNHDNWELELDDKYPELKGCFDRTLNLSLSERGWRVLRMGSTFKYGKLYYAHGEALSGQYHARKAVDTYCRNLVYGHFHSLQVHSKVLPQDQSQKWTSVCLPILGHVNPDYLEGRPTAWTNGFGLVEYHPNGFFNLYPIVVSKGAFAYGGKVFRG